MALGVAALLVKELHLLHQLLGQWKDLVFGAEDVVNRDAAGDLLKVQKLYLQCKCSTLEVVLFDASDQLQHRMIQMNGDGGILTDVRLEGLLTADTLPLPFADNRPIVDASREIIEHLPHLAELLRQSTQRHVSQVKDCEDTHSVHLLGSLLANTPDLLYLQLGDEVQGPVRVNHRQSVGFAPVGGNLRQEVSVAHTSRCCQSSGLTDALLDFSRNIHPQLNPFLILCHIEKGFVE